MAGSLCIKDQGNKVGHQGKSPPSVGVGVISNSGVDVSVGVGVTEGVRVGVLVGLGVLVGVGVTVGVGVRVGTWMFNLRIFSA